MKELCREAVNTSKWDAGGSGQLYSSADSIAEYSSAGTAAGSSTLQWLFKQEKTFREPS